MRMTTLVVRSSQDPTSLTAALRGAVLEVDPEQPIWGVSTMKEVVAGSLGNQRFNMVLLGAFALAAQLMAAIGLYGVLSFAVASAWWPWDCCSAVSLRSFLAALSPASCTASARSTH